MFTKMERIKICYLLLKKHLRIENLNKFNLTLFALEDDYEKLGSVGTANSLTYHKWYEDAGRIRKPEIEGGIDGKNLIESWARVSLWRNNFKVIRGYLGEDKAFEVFIKTFLVFLFMILFPFGVGGELIKRFLVRS